MCCAFGADVRPVRAEPNNHAKEAAPRQHHRRRRACRDFIYGRTRSCRAPRQLGHNAVGPRCVKIDIRSHRQAMGARSDSAPGHSALIDQKSFSAGLRAGSTQFWPADNRKAAGIRTSDICVAACAGSTDINIRKIRRVLRKGASDHHRCIWLHTMTRKSFIFD